MNKKYELLDLLGKELNLSIVVEQEIGMTNYVLHPRDNHRSCAILHEHI